MIVQDLAEVMTDQVSIAVMIDLVLIVPPHQVIVQLIHCHSNCEERMKIKPVAPANTAPRRDSVDKKL